MTKYKGHSSGEVGRILSFGAALSRGQDVVEFAIVFVLFFILCFVVMDFGWLMFAEVNIQQAVDDAGRYASTGQETASGERLESIIQILQNEIAIPGVNPSNITICSTPPGGTTATCCGPSYTSMCSGGGGAAGGPGSTVTLTLSTSLSVLMPWLGYFKTNFSTLPGSYSFSASSTFKNEPFNPTSTD